MWAIGNENNYHNGSEYDYYSLCNKLAEIAYQLEGDTYHPVIIVNGHLTNIGVREKEAEDMQLNYIDAWGCSVYLESFYDTRWHTDQRNLFEVYEEKSLKPIIITAYGSDAFYTTDPETLEGYEDEDMQADWVRDNTLEIMAATDVCIGGCVMEYSDEWWKDENGDPSTHDTGGYEATMGNTSPDNYANEEYWGIVQIGPDGTWSEPDGLDDIRRRKVYYILEALYKGEIDVVPGESIQNAIDNCIDNGVVHVLEGTYEEDISIRDTNGLRLMGDINGGTIVEGTISFEDSDSSIEDFTIHYKDGGTLSYSDDYYTDFKLLKDAGITAINSEITVKNCIIMPDQDIFMTNYGKGIQIWNLYGSLDINPVIEDNLIQNAHTGIYLYSQAFGGAINGIIQDNDLQDNDYGIVLRMHKEKPYIDNNTISNSIHGIHLTYYDLYFERCDNITENNTFPGCADDIYCDELGE